MLETNIQLLHAARDALAIVQAREGRSRDGTVRWLLEKHVREQEERDFPDRLTHISTVLRHPLRPRNPKDPYPASPLRLRLGEGLAARARAVALRLPGQPQRRGGRDYQARPLTDSVVTAIAGEAPIRDALLEGLMPVIRHRAADGLWRLAVAATATRTERALFEQTSDPYATQDRVTQELLWNEVAWHSPWRLDVLWILADHYLRGADARTAEQMLFDQGRDFELAWADLLERTGLEDDDLEDLPSAVTRHEGRAGAAVWRAHRVIEKTELAPWLVGQRGGGSRQVTPPGWVLTVPEGWVGVAPRDGSPELEKLRLWIERRSVLRLAMGSRVLVWPLRVEKDGVRPVPGVEAVLRELAKVATAEVIEIILRDQRNVADEVADPDVADLDEDEDEDGDEDEVGESLLSGPLEVPAYTAKALGLIDAATCSALVADAENRTRQTMTGIMAVLPPPLAGDHELIAATSCPAEFNDLLRRHQISRVVWEFKPRWSWPVVSLADQVVAGAPPLVLSWLARHLRVRHAATLRASQYRAWTDALARYSW